MAYKNSCPTLKKVADDEPIFVLRAQDVTAPVIVMEWIRMNQQISDEKMQEAIECIKAMRRWPKTKSAD